MDFQFSLHLLVLRNEVITVAAILLGGRSANLATKLLKKVTQLQEDVRRHSLERDIDGRWLTRSSSAL